MDDAEILGRTIWAEARGESLEGKIAVANSVLNRVEKKSWYGNTISKVCLKPYAYSCWLPSDPNFQKLKSITTADPVFAQCMAVAKDGADGILEDNIEGATHYKVVGSYAKWAQGKEPCIVIGRHEFFNNIN